MITKDLHSRTDLLLLNYEKERREGGRKEGKKVREQRKERER